MRQGLRRTIGLGGAAFVAVGAALVLTLPASAHATVATPGCAKDSHATIEVHTTVKYDVDKTHPKNNSITITEGNTTLFGPDMFGQTYSNTVTLTVDSTKTHDVNVHVQSWNNIGTMDIPLTTLVCSENKPPTSTTTAAPTTTTMAPATTTSTTAVVAAATTAAPAATLPNTGVNAAFPLLIAGVLVVAGGGILLWLRLGAKRRRTDS
ncbi:MAG TPA: LPXTG cell wall anchor domain-containing protein [Pseudonocardiaceae bacterium]